MENPNVRARSLRHRLLESTAPKPVSVSEGDLVRFESLPGLDTLPLVVRANMPNLDLPAWLASNLAFISTRLCEHGGILFRDFALNGVDDFQRVLNATGIELMQYVESATPRTALGGNVYTSTEFSAGHLIAPHNELSSSVTFPMKIWFLCLQPADTGGETPIVDVRRVFNRIDPDIRNRFTEKGWKLVRNFGEGVGLSWQSAFHVSSRSELEDYCLQHDIQPEWREGDRLRTRQVRTAVASHPVTREMVWFNHIAFWHISSLEPGVREATLAAFKEEDLPYNTYYGDGSPIEDSVAAALREAYRSETVAFSWQKGDLLMLDNMLVAHGRNPFSGSRKVLAAMGEPSTRRM